MKKKLIIAFSILAVLLILVIGSGSLYAANVLNAGENLTINPINLSSIKDGTYTGTYEGGIWSNEVKVTVSNQQITQVDVVKDITIEEADIKNAIISKVITEQNTTVDVISGATVTCNAYLKSIENALSQ